MSKSYQVDFHQEVAEKTRGKFLDAVFKWRQVYRQCPVLIETVVSSHLGFRFDWWREDVQKEAIKKWFQKCCGGVLSSTLYDVHKCIPDQVQLDSVELEIPSLDAYVNEKCVLDFASGARLDEKWKTWTVGLEIGHGSCGAVRKLTQGPLAAARKKLQMKGFETQVFRELVNLEKCNRHPHVVRLLDACCGTEIAYIYMECVDTDIYQLCQSRQLSAPEIRLATSHVLAGVSHVHSVSIIHGDLEPTNIGARLQNGTGAIAEVLLLDFSNSLSVASYSPPCRIDGRGFQVQSLGFRSPELLCEVADVSQAADMWSIGATVMYMFLRRFVFPTDSEKCSAKSILERCEGADSLVGQTLRSYR